MIGALLPGANAVLFFAERNVPTGLASLIIASVPLWVVVLRLAARERLPGRRWSASASASPASPSWRSRPAARRRWGIALCLLSALMWATGSVLSARLDDARGPVRRDRATRCSPAASLMLPIAVFTVHGFSPSTGSILGWIYLVTFGSIVGYTAYVWLLANAPLGLVSTYAYVNPVVAIRSACLFRGEDLTWRLLIGAAIVVAAVALVVRQRAAVGDPARGRASR